MSETWTIAELADRAAGLLRDSGQRVNGRVREVPSERLIRWYTTIGLLDPPLTRRGRVALYGRRHLLQLVAVKRMQAEGSSIAEIQITLAGATDTMLAQAAGLPLDPPTAPAPPPAPSAPPARPLPVPPLPTAPLSAAPPPTAAQPTAAAPPSPPAPDPRPSPPAHPGRRPQEPGVTEGAGPRFWARRAESPSWPVHGVRLAQGVTLLIDGAGRPPTEDDLEAVLAAAGPLLAVLEERRLHEGSAT
ncbi:MerR family transcriptional regulator [Nonomuraea dietziae]|uniref:MerR family transcriptional regulator n=1 Tax=Nonomuraea dietziae TaxID=65515 RepID=UPI0033CCE612